MGIRSKWRAGHMKDPVSGVFRVTDWYSSSSGRRLTGVIVADGVPVTPVEAKADNHGKWVGHDELPVTVDRADPHNFRIEWDQIVKTDWRATARQRALDEATKMAGGVSAMDNPPGGGPVTNMPPGGTVSGAGQIGSDLAATIQQALRSAGMDPAILSSPNTTVHVETSLVAPPQAVFAQQAGATVPATGVVRAVHDVTLPPGMPPGMSQADLTIDVHRPDGTTHPATTRIGFSTPARRAAIATVGTTLPLLVNPNDPGRLVIDLSRIDLP